MSTLAFFQTQFRRPDCDEYKFRAGCSGGGGRCVGSADRAFVARNPAISFSSEITVRMRCRACANLSRGAQDGSG
jgi:hypothetical protein